MGVKIITRCRQCNGPVIWLKVDGKLNCYNPPDAKELHWDVCSKRRWKQVVETGARFEGEYDKEKHGVVSGYRTKKGRRLDRIEAKPIRGVDYKPCGCDCGLPPWEVCKSDCVHAISPL